jgi:putative copper export protein
MLLVILRFIHIVLGVLWVGSIFAVSAVLAPGMQELGLPLDPLIRTLTHKKFSQMMMAFGGLTVLAGLAMMYILSRGHEADFYGSHFGRTLSLGGLCAILALVLGGAIQRPAVEKAGRIQADLKNNPPKGDDPRVAEVARLQARAVRVGKLVVGFLLFAVACMAVARYI